jgi:hypothetical protein
VIMLSERFSGIDHLINDQRDLVVSITLLTIREILWTSVMSLERCSGIDYLINNQS